jgi:hypothetical protein
MGYNAIKEVWDEVITDDAYLPLPQEQEFNQLREVYRHYDYKTDTRRTRSLSIHDKSVFRV